MTTVLLLFLVGVILLATDVFMSSFVMAAIGGVSLIAGCLVAYRDFGAIGAGLGAGAAVVLIGATIYFELFVLPKTRLGRDLVVKSTAGSTSQPPIARAEAVVGRPAEALTTMAPSGYVLVDGRRYEAYSQSGHADKGATLRVVGVDNFRLIVSKS